MVDDGSDCAAFDDFAAYYDIADLDRATEVGFYCNLVRDEARSLLDLGCGTGTITIPMARKLAERHGPAVRVVGVDISDKMLELARRAAPHIEWRHGDMRAPSVAGTFDIAVCCFNGLQLLLKDDDLLQCFRSVRSLLASDGIFAFGIYKPNVEFLNGSHPDHVVRSFSDEQGRRLEVLEGGSYDPSAKVLKSDWLLLEQGRADAAPIARMHVMMRQYFPEEIERLLAAAGLTMRERYGDYDRSPFTAASKRQVVVCGLA